MEDTDLNWRKSSHSGNGGSDCVKVGDRVLVRDTKNRTGPVLEITPGAWRTRHDPDRHARHQKRLAPYSQLYSSIGFVHGYRTLSADELA
jgi:hypothetical protein